MALLLLFAFLAGVVTILSPCILPVLPIVLSSTLGGTESKSRPFGVALGFIASFTFFTLFLSSIIKFTGIPSDTLRIIAIIIIAGFGLSLLIPQVQVKLEQLFSKLSQFSPRRNTSTGFGSGFAVGLSLGLLWTPCVGPILASVIALAITGTVTFDAFLITIAYALGTAIPMFLIIKSGQRVLQKVPWLVSRTAMIQKVFGVIMIITALAILTNIDRTFQSFIIGKFPQYGKGLTQIEDSAIIRSQLQDTNADNSQIIGKPMPNPGSIPAPELIPGGEWINTKPLTLAQLKGKVVLIDFWTYSCINCQRTLPYLKNWWEKYHDKGLVIIGVHAPEFAFEKNPKNVQKAVGDFGIPYPVMQDNDFSTWRAYNNHYWPAKYFIDKQGYIRHTHFGEGEYDESEEVIQELLKEAGAKDLQAISNPTYQIYAQTPETYLGYSRIEYLSSPESVAQDQITQYSAQKAIPTNQFAYEGQWQIMKEYASPQPGARLYLNFESKQVFLVMRSKGKPAKVRVYLDDKQQYGGADVKNGIVIVDSDRLYTLINLSNPGRHILRLEFEDANAELYAFTFG